MKEIDEQIKWIASGRIGCVFASALVKQADKIGWFFQYDPNKLEIPKNCHILSILFPNKNIHEVRQWSISNGFYIEDVHEMYEGLRIKMKDGISWVQYFGPDSHVKTRQAPYSMISFTVKLPPLYFIKVGFEGILHLAHASINHVGIIKAQTLWNQSIIKTKKELGFSPTIREAAKTTFKK